VLLSLGKGSVVLPVIGADMNQRNMNGIGSLDFPLYVLFQNAFASSLENKATIGPGAVSPIICLQECTAFHALLKMFDHRVFAIFQRAL